jgi:hypothetical protein
MMPAELRADLSDALDISEAVITRTLAARAADADSAR